MTTLVATLWRQSVPTLLSLPVDFTPREGLSGRRQRAGYAVILTVYKVLQGRALDVLGRYDPRLAATQMYPWLLKKV